MTKAFIFPGQGAQYPGMGKDFVAAYAPARQTLELADDILGRKLSDIVLNGTEDVLKETKNSQIGIYVISIAILRTMQELFPEIMPSFCAGLSLGEYTAATAAGYLSFEDALPIVQLRGQCMNDACERHHGTMAVVLGLDADAVEDLVKEAGMPRDLWSANFNCPGQVVLSGTLKGIEAGTALALQHGAKRVLPLQVHGAFHSGLMEEARNRLAEPLMHVPLQSHSAQLVMNVTGKTALSEEELRRNLIAQVTMPVKWEQSIREMDRNGVSAYVEMGPGKTLAGFNKRIAPSGKTHSIEKVGDLKIFEEFLSSF